jgi:hypothetical protein
VAEARSLQRTRRAACVVGGALITGVCAPPAQAADVAKPAAAASRPAPATSPDAVAGADLELLEFLGTDDVDPELQQYLANRANARDGSGRK